MNKIIFAIIMILISISGFAQENREIKLTEKADTLLTLIQKDIEFLRYRYEKELETKEYELYPTQNMWNFLELNTATGQIYQIQYSMNSNERLYVTINSENLNNSYQKYIGVDTGRFKLYPTQNMYSFLLLDKVFGRVWQVQWGLKDKDRLIIRIK